MKFPENQIVNVLPRKGVVGLKSEALLLMSLSHVSKFATALLKRFFSLHIFFFQIKVCSSTTSTGCEGIHEISEKLKTVSSKGENHIVEDVKLTVDVVEKIITHVDLSNIEKTPKV